MSLIDSRSVTERDADVTVGDAVGCQLSLVVDLLVQTWWCSSAGTGVDTAVDAGVAHTGPQDALQWLCRYSRYNG